MTKKNSQTKYVSSSTVILGEETIKPGQPFELGGAEAAGLLARKRITVFDPNAAIVYPTIDAPKPEGEELATAIIDAIAGVDPENAEAMNGAGVISTHYLKSVLGYEVTAEERDAAVEAMTAPSKK